MKGLNILQNLPLKISNERRVVHTNELRIFLIDFLFCAIMELASGIFTATAISQTL
jgi:hypothetical protein